MILNSMGNSGYESRAQTSCVSPEKVGNWAVDPPGGASRWLGAGVHPAFPAPMCTELAAQGAE